MSNKLIDVTHQYRLPSGVKVFRVSAFEDDRGSLMPTFSNEDNVFGDNFLGIKQVNIIKTKRHVLRGAHVSLEPQHKLIMVTKGKVTQVLQDLRPFNNSRDECTEYTIEHGGGVYTLMVLVPPFIANALYSETKANIIYATDTYFNEDLELSVALSHGNPWDYGNPQPLESEKDSASILPTEAMRKIYEYHSN